MMKRILIVMTTPLTLDGISAMVLNYFKHFSQTHFKYEFVVSNDVNEWIREEIESRGGVIHKLPVRTREPLKYFKALKALMKERSYSIVHAQGNSATLYIEMLAAKRAGIPIRISHSHTSMCSHVAVHMLLKRIFNKSYTHAFACSKKAGDWLFKGDYEIINNGIELNKYAYKPEIREKVRDELGLSNKKVIGHVGNYVYAKNHDYIISIFSHLLSLDSDYRLMLVGEGELMSRIQDKVNSLGLIEYVYMMGSRSDVPDLLQAMDLFLMPSHFEGLPFVLIEAQAAGLPCAVSEKVTQEVNLTGLLTYISLNETPNEWANVINKNIENKDRNLVSINACKSLQAAGYDIDIEAEKLEKRYLSMLEVV